jgi:hypothetical protein
MDAALGYISRYPDPERAIQLLLHGVCPDNRQQKLLQHDKINLYYCLVKRIESLEKSNRQSLSKQVIQAEDISTLTTALIDTREQHQALEGKFLLLQEKFELLASKFEELEVKSELKKLNSESKVEELEKQLKQLQKERAEPAKQPINRLSASTSTSIPSVPFFKKE